MSGAKVRQPSSYDGLACEVPVATVGVMRPGWDDVLTPLMTVAVVPTAFPDGVLTDRDLDVRIGRRPGGVTDRHLAWWLGRCRRRRQRSDTDGPSKQRPDERDPQVRRTMRSPRRLVHVFLHCSGRTRGSTTSSPWRSWRSLPPEYPPVATIHTAASPPPSAENQADCPANETSRRAKNHGVQRHRTAMNDLWCVQGTRTGAGWPLWRDPRPSAPVRPCQGACRQMAARTL